MQFVQILSIIVKILPYILQAIKAVEAEIPGAGKGAEKLGLVQEILRAGYDAYADDNKISFDEILPLVNKIINSAVAVFKKTGSFDAPKAG